MIEQAIVVGAVLVLLSAVVVIAHVFDRLIEVDAEVGEVTMVGPHVVECEVVDADPDAVPPVYPPGMGATAGTVTTKQYRCTVCGETRDTIDTRAWRGSTCLGIPWTDRDRESHRLE